MTHPRFGLATAVSIAAALLLATTAFAADTCLTVLGTKAYNCDFVQQTGETYKGCVRFESPGQVGEFDMRAQIEFPAGSRKLLGGCSCGAKGSLKKPQFDAAKSFDCLFIDASRTSNDFAGKASKTKISAGRITAPDGRSIIFACQVPRGPAIPCLACQPAGQPCGAADGPCCTGLTCSGALGQTPTCH
jgi:hypothetical protein